MKYSSSSLTRSRTTSRRYVTCWTTKSISIRFRCRQWLVRTWWIWVLRWVTKHTYSSSKSVILIYSTNSMAMRRKWRTSLIKRCAITWMRLTQRSWNRQDGIAYQSVMFNMTSFLRFLTSIFKTWRSESWTTLTRMQGLPRTWERVSGSWTLKKWSINSTRRLPT